MLQQVLKQVGLQNTISQLPDGLNSQLGVNGIPLTSEQSLRLTLARAMLKRPRLLLLDGVLDRIDADILPALLEVLVAHDAPWTLIVNSHHPRVIARCQRHIRIEQGVPFEITTDIDGKNQ
jgi:ABC-type transport system involved in cytochrome bd biosynthesis fused ATPase/permease subunit